MKTIPMHGSIFFRVLARSCSLIALASLGACVAQVDGAPYEQDDEAFAQSPEEVAESAEALTTEVCDGIDNDGDTLVDEGNVCGCSSVTYGGHSYAICSTNTHWFEARQACLAQNLDLVKIDDAAENQFLTPYVSGYGSWIGMRDTLAEGIWVWTDGTIATYTHFASGEPNGGTSENYGQMWPGGTWNDITPTWNNGFICETHSGYCESNSDCPAVASQCMGGVCMPNNALLYLDAQHPASYPGYGPTWKDLSGHGNHFTHVSQSPTRAADGAFLFSASQTNNYFQGPGGVWPKNAEARTILAWAVPFEAPGYPHHKHIFHYGTAQAKKAFGLTQRYESNVSGHEWNYDPVGQPWSNGELALVGISVAADANTRTVYKNGTAQVVDTGYAPQTTLGSAAFIGSRISGPYELFEGKIYSIWIYGKVLSTQEIDYIRTHAAPDSY